MIVARVGWDHEPRGLTNPDTRRPPHALADARLRRPPALPFQLIETTGAASGTHVAASPHMNPTRVLEESQIGRYTVRMAIIVNWNGVDVPEELKGLKKGRYVLLPMDEAPEPTEEQEASLEAALASVRAGKGVSLDEAERAALDAAITRAWASVQAGEGRSAADVLADLAKR